MKIKKMNMCHGKRENGYKLDTMREAKWHFLMVLGRGRMDGNLKPTRKKRKKLLTSK